MVDDHALVDLDHIHSNDQGTRRINWLATRPLDDISIALPDDWWMMFCSGRRGEPDLFIMDLERPSFSCLFIASQTMKESPAIPPSQNTLFFVSTHDNNADALQIDVLPQDTMNLSAAGIRTMPSRIRTAGSISGNDTSLYFFTLFNEGYDVGQISC